MKIPNEYTEVNVSSIESVKPMNNTVLVKNISDSLDDYHNKRVITVIRNKANKKRELSIGKVVSTSGLTTVACHGGMLEVDLEPDMDVVYDTHSQLLKFIVENDSSDYYLIRVPDIIGSLTY